MKTCGTYRTHIRSLTFLSSSGDPETRGWRWERWPPAQRAQGQKKGQPGRQWAEGLGAPTEPQTLGTERQKHFISPCQSVQSVEPQLHARPRTARWRSQWEVGAWAKEWALLSPYYFPLCSLHFINLPAFFQQIGKKIKLDCRWLHFIYLHIQVLCHHLP